MTKNEKIFFKLVERGVFKLYKNGKIYKCKRKIQWKNEYKDCKLRLMKTMSSKGYIHIGFSYNEKVIHIKAHRAIWIFFNGEILKGLEINHKNGVKDDNRLSSLELVTRSKNCLHAYKMGLINVVGENNGNHKLTEKKVLKVRKLLKEGLSQRKIAKIFDVNKGAISHINVGRSWAWLT